MFRESQIIVPPAQEPITLEELKTSARTTDPEDPIKLAEFNALLMDRIAAARERCEGFTRSSLITQTRDLWYDGWQQLGVIENIPYGPIQSVVGIYAYDDTGAMIVASPDSYEVYGGNTIVFSDWIPYTRAVYGLRLQVITGYGDEPEDVPDALRVGLIEYATHLYEYRLGEPQQTEYAAGAQTQSKAGALPLGVYDKWRRWQLVLA